jgi:hypothetical protein
MAGGFFSLSLSLSLFSLFFFPLILAIETSVFLFSFLNYLI